MDTQTILAVVSMIVAGAAVAIGSIGTAIAQGRSVDSALDAMARQPDLGGADQSHALHWPGDDRVAGDLLSGRRVNPALRQPVHSEIAGARVTFNVWTFLFEVLNFLVLAFVLYRLLYRPLREAIEKRKADNERARTEAEAARQEANAAKEQLAAKLAEADKDRQALLRKAVEQAEVEKVKRLAEAESAATAIREQARHDAEQLRSDTIAGLERDVGMLAVGLADRLLTGAANTSLNCQLMRRLVETVHTISGAERERVRQDAGKSDAVVESATAIDESTRSELAVAIRELLGRAIEMKVDVKPALIAGGLLRLGGHVWDASAAAQLAAAKMAVVEDQNG